MSSEILIETKNLVKEFKIRTHLGKRESSIRAVDNVSITIARGENLALVGESGSGKSTLGRLTLGLIKPTSGTVYYKGKDIWKMSKEDFKEFRKNAQIIHQDPYSSVNPVKTIFYTLSSPLLQHKIARNKREAYEMVSELLRRVGLEPPSDFMNRYPSRMSGGQLQRIAIARAISLKPKYIVADEAVSMLDASLRLEIIDLLLDLQKEYGMSYLFITHDLGITRYFIFKGGGKIAVMYLGSLVEYGEGEEVIRNAYHPYTRILVEASPIPDPKLARSRGLPPLRSLDIPSLTNIPSGCKFSSRCPYAQEICEKEIPKLRKVNDRYVACHFAEKFVKSRY